MKPFTKKGFTLVEIMIVVVIIGLLAALAIPAFKKVRNTAIEKTIYNDARQLSSAANQYWTENATTTCLGTDLIGASKFVSSLSSGTLVKNGVGTTNLLASNLWNGNGVLAGLTLSASNGTTPANSLVQIGNLGYDTSLSGNAQITDATKGGYGNTSTTGNNFLKFSVETGALLKKAATAATDTAIYA